MTANGRGGRSSGQQIMKLAQPQFVEVEVQVPVADAVTLSEEVGLMFFSILIRLNAIAAK